jgi:hypothetical protein
VSASEKLKALEQGATAGEWAAVPSERNPDLGRRYVTVGERHKFRTLMRSEADALLAVALANALPQIVAVVEVGELYAKVLDDAHLMKTALAALDKAMGGDE